MSLLRVPQGTFALERHPPSRDPSLRAWDAADELALTHLDAEAISLEGGVVIANDAFGALTTALAAHRPWMCSDSYIAERATALNLARNDLPVALVGPGDRPLPDRIDVLVVKVPKALALLEDQLRLVAPRLHAGSTVVGAAMARHVHTSTLDVFERVIGPTRTSRAVRKARLVLAAVDTGRDPGPWPWPRSFAVPGEGVTAMNLPGVFSATSLDVGTRILLEHLPADRDGQHIIDLGCGNGVVGVTAQLRNPSARLTFVDESRRAVASARLTYRASVPEDRPPPATPPRFVVGDGLSDLATVPPVEPGSVDLVLNNPPFHADHVLGDATAWAMFTDARTALRPGGELWVVGNRHLAYHAKLRRLFGTAAVEVVASNAKFVVLRATRR